MSSGQRSIAAFFDLDGTLMPEPSLERRLMRFLYWRKDWSPVQLARWVLRYLKVCALPSSMARDERWVRATHGNKMYWKNVRVASAREFGRRTTQLRFFAEGIERMEWHARQGHKIFLVSGTLDVLAEGAAEELREAVRVAPWPEASGICATRMEESGGRWTGEVRGAAMWGMEKARAIERLEREHQINLAESFAYANSASDLAMLRKVGRPVAVNPERGLRRTAKSAGWAVVWWKERKSMALRKERGLKTFAAAAGDGIRSPEGRA